MSVPPAVTGLAELRANLVVARMLEWNSSAVEDATLDRNELSVYVTRARLRDACEFLRDDQGLQFRHLSDLTCCDWHPSEPRFHMVYHLLSLKLKQRVRLKVRLAGNDAVLDSVVPVWPGANLFEREVFDLFGIRFNGHPYLRRLMMPEDWEGHPLRKDYPVEGYR